MVKLEGSVADIRFRNEENYYTIFNLDTTDGMVTVVGKVMQINVGDTVRLSGDLIYHDLYGEQIRLKDYEKIMPTGLDQIEKYLSSGLIPFIGKKMARDIVRKFGQDSLEIMTNEPDKLLAINGIGQKKLEAIKKAVLKENEARDTIIFLQSLGLGSRLSAEIYKKYKNMARVIIEENPYVLIDDIRGIGFNIADNIALKNNVRPDSPFRIGAALIYILGQAASLNGNCYLERKELVDLGAKLIGKEASLIDGQLVSMEFEGRIKLETFEDGKEIVYLRSIYEIEKSIVSYLLKLLLRENKQEGKNLDKLISKIEKEDKISYSDKQKDAIKSAIEENLLVITGGPGTGKTTLIKAIISLADKLNLKFTLCAPTGRAAKRMEESTGQAASTIHRLLGYKSLEDEYAVLDFNEENPIDSDLIIVDEMSMVDIFLMNNLLKAVGNDTKLIFVGDSDQLPSVGPGNVLNDLIKSKTIKTIGLDIVFRQGEKSNIVRNAHLINGGKKPVLNEENQDFFFIKTKNDHDTLNTIVDLVANRLPKHYGLDPIRDIQVLSPTKKGVCGTENLNTALQQVLNQADFNKSELKHADSIFRERDKVMQVKNNYDIDLKDKYGNISKGIFNGDIGFIRNVFTDDTSIEVLVDDRIVTYQYKDFSEISLSYAITVHKSQGSEFPIVIIPMARAPYLLMTRNILYTAITRGKKIVVLVGDENIMYKMIENSYRQRRNSRLAQYLAEAYSFFEEEDDK
ncbi:SF1B family DNA helicase RecD2 [Peptoniphilaceae bacterium SGI.131]